MGKYVACVEYDVDKDTSHCTIYEIKFLSDEEERKE